MSTTDDQIEPIEIHMTGDMCLSEEDETEAIEPMTSYYFARSDLRATRQIDSIHVNTPPYAELLIYDTERWSEEHNRLLKAKIDYYTETVKNNHEPLRSFLFKSYLGNMYPMISLIYTKKPFKAGNALLNEMSEQLQQEGIPHRWFFKYRKTHTYEEMLWERPKPLSTYDFMDALHRGGLPDFKR